MVTNGLTEIRFVGVVRKKKEKWKERIGGVEFGNGNKLRSVSQSRKQRGGGTNAFDLPSCL